MPSACDGCQIKCFSGCESQIKETPPPLAKVNAVIEGWYAAYCAGRLDAGHYRMMRPTLAAMMLLPEAARRELCGDALEKLYNALGQEGETNHG